MVIDSRDGKVDCYSEKSCGACESYYILLLSSLCFFFRHFHSLSHTHAVQASTFVCIEFADEMANAREMREDWNKIDISTDDQTQNASLNLTSNDKKTLTSIIIKIRYSLIFSTYILQWNNITCKSNFFFVYFNHIFSIIILLQNTFFLKEKKSAKTSH